MTITEVEGAPGWHIERDPRSAGTFGPAASSVPDECSWTYRLGPGQPAGQYVAAARAIRFPVPTAWDRVRFVGHSGRPMRLSVQVRVPNAGDGQRWGRSVYLDETPREIEVPFDGMRPIGHTDTARPDLGRVDSLLFVVDTTHTRPGTEGEVWLRHVRLEGTGPAS